MSIKDYISNADRLKSPSHAFIEQIVPCAAYDLALQPNAAHWNLEVVTQAHTKGTRWLELDRINLRNVLARAVCNYYFVGKVVAECLKFPCPVMGLETKQSVHRSERWRPCVCGVKHGVIKIA